MCRKQKTIYGNQKENIELNKDLTHIKEEKNKRSCIEPQTRPTKNTNIRVNHPLPKPLWLMTKKNIRQKNFILRDKIYNEDTVGHNGVRRIAMHLL